MDNANLDTGRSLKLKVKADRVEMGGNWLDQPLPINMLKQIDPFLLIHHWKDILPGGNRERELGVGPHPHRGFSPVSIIFKGDVHHRDSLGNSTVVKAGGTQWMNAGKGITHSERPSKELAEKGGETEFIQFWVNSPANAKTQAAHYQALQPGDTLKLSLEDGLSKIHLIAGSLLGKRSSIQTDSPLLILRLDHQSGAAVSLPVDESYNAVLYLLSGEIELSDSQKANEKEMLWFRNDGTQIDYKALQNTQAILLAGAPINEPMVQYGPFVLNTENEIMEALRDSRIGKMGILIEEFES